jgi:hypothetical protein
MSKVRGFKRQVHEATIVRMKNFTNPTSAVLLNVVKCGAHCRFTPELIAEIRAWVLRCNKLIESPNASDSIMVKCPITGKKKKERKFFYMFSVRDIHTELVKPVSQGGFAGAYNEEGKLIISDTALRNMLPKNVSRMSDSQKQTCGCEICLNTYSMMLALNS